MKKLLILLVFAISLFGILGTTLEANATTRVKSYFKKSGTYVAPYYRTSSNSTKLDNWSTKGNYNHFTGKKGYVKPYKIKY